MENWELRGEPGSPAFALPHRTASFAPTAGSDFWPFRSRNMHPKITWCRVDFQHDAVEDNGYRMFPRMYPHQWGHVRYRTYESSQASNENGPNGLERFRCTVHKVDAMCFMLPHVSSISMDKTRQGSVLLYFRIPQTRTCDADQTRTEQQSNLPVEPSSSKV